ncbi:HU family DNA-binding protein [Weissella cibaria]|jgi:Bacterial nucleoid DNA-binding protein|uniref:DNA-binding protein HU n=1 Tax=Weissella cibaria TaxID=137591 RepID=A0A0D1KED1_9LACO|nr:MULTISPECIES: HU family DNA-binding protein [Weissella]ALI32877.1 DNA-binding protein [Weissella cibaria]APS27072.1 DNA-binding protein HU [Weissella cibaria]APU62469.1 DNA-binding protein HU [Weissella cibaria]APU64621.1 DNA-binding protein HU [Weissella cibaria]ASS52000.1 DNA-binding protein HU [Weissella cibaria]
MASKTELIDLVAAKTGQAKSETTKTVNALLDVIKDQLAQGEKVALVGFGTFEVRERAARKGRNPQTGAEIEIAAAKAPAFKAGKDFKEAVNK